MRACGPPPIPASWAPNLHALRVHARFRQMIDFAHRLEHCILDATRDAVVMPRELGSYQRLKPDPYDKSGRHRFELFRHLRFDHIAGQLVSTLRNEPAVPPDLDATLIEAKNTVLNICPRYMYDQLKPITHYDCLIMLDELDEAVSLFQHADKQLKFALDAQPVSCTWPPRQPPSPWMPRR